MRRVGLHNVRFGAEDLVHALHRGEALLDGIDGFAEILSWIDDAVENDEVINECRGVDGAVVAEDERSTVPEDDDDRSGAEELTHGVGQLLATVDAVRGAAEGLILCLEALLDLPLGVERLDDAQPTERLLDLTHQRPPLCLPHERLALELLTHLTHRIASHGQEDEDESCQLPTDQEHGREVNQNEDGILEQHVERTHDRGLNLVHVARDARQDVAFALLGEEAERQLGDLAIDLVAHVAHHAGADGDHGVESHVHGQHLEERHHDQRYAEQDERCGAALGLNEVVDVPVEVVLQHTGERTPCLPVGDRAKRPRGIGVDAVVHLKEDAQDGNDEREGEDVEDGGEDVEGDVQRHEAFVGRNEPSQDAEEVFHILSIRGMNLAWG